MNANEFFVKVWSLLALVIIVLISSLTSIRIINQYKAAEMVKLGFSPIEVACLTDDLKNSGLSSICTALLLSKVNK